MKEFIIEKVKRKPKMKNPIMIEGLPGIGNVARISADFLIEKLKAKKIMNIYSVHFPNSVFITDDKNIELPKVEVYHAKYKKKDFLIVIGDVQPAEEAASYKFSEFLVDLAKKLKVKEIITLGGINADTTEKPTVYGACTHKKYKKKLKKAGVRFDRKGAVIIVGAAGLMLGLGKIKKINGFVLLAEAKRSKSNICLSASKAVLKVLMKYFKMKFSLKDLKMEINTPVKLSKRKIKKKLLKQAKQNSIPVSELKYIG